MGSKTAELVEEVTDCPECGSERLVRDYTRGELLCESCGLVVDDKQIDTGPEWTAYDSEDRDKLSRTGAPRNYTSQSINLTTIITTSNRDSRGNRIPVREIEKFHRMRKLQHHSGRSRPGERSLPETLRALDRVSSFLELPKSIREEAGFICKKALEKGFLRGRSIEALVAAAIYSACRMSGVPRTLEEISSVTGLTRKVIAKAYGALSRLLQLRVPPSKPADYISRFCSELELGTSVQTEARRILKQIDDVDGSLSLSPVGTSAAAIYLASLACGERRPQKAIAKVAGVSEVTLRNRFQLVNKAFMSSLSLPRGRVPKRQRIPRMGS
jgi:transcription initiation factor TFIIB